MKHGIEQQSFSKLFHLVSLGWGGRVFEKSKIWLFSTLRISRKSTPGCIERQLESLSVTLISFLCDFQACRKDEKKATDSSREYCTYTG